MSSFPSLRLVPYREVRHDAPDDCLHYEPVTTRFEELNWTVPVHRHEGLHQFQLLTAGHLEGSIDGRRVEARAGALLMLAPGAMHGFTYSHDAAGHQITVPSSTLARLLEGFAMAADSLGASFALLDLPTAVVAKFSALFESLAQEFRAHHPGRVQALLALTTLLAVQVIRLHEEDADRAQRPGTRDTLVQRYLALVEAHHRAHWPIQAYAQAMGITADHLSHTCKTLTGESALEILHARVLLEARRLLAYTPAPVTEIAEQLGYADSPYFSRFFRKGVGHTPSEYRRLVAQGVRSTGD